MTIIRARASLPISILVPVALLLIEAPASAQAAASKTDFGVAYAAAETAEKEAGRLRNQWTVTAAALTEARRAADRGDFDQALAAAKEAEALAKASISQATSEKEAWKNLEIR